MIRNWNVCISGSVFCLILGYLFFCESGSGVCDTGLNVSPIWDGIALSGDRMLATWDRLVGDPV